MRTGNRPATTLSLFALAVAVALAGCAETSKGSETAGSEVPSDKPVASPSPTRAKVDSPTPAFADISEEPVSKELAKELQAALALHDVADGSGMSAMVMSAEGTWSGTTGAADGARNLQRDDQFSTASITKSVVAAQVMLIVEAGEVGLGDLVADHLPGDLHFDTNEATIRHLLSHRTGLPDYYELGPLEKIQADPQRVWTTTELLKLVPTWRAPPGSTFSYVETNYLLLKLVIEHRRGRRGAHVRSCSMAEVAGNAAIYVDATSLDSMRPASTRSAQAWRACWRILRTGQCCRRAYKATTRHAPHRRNSPLATTGHGPRLRAVKK